MSDAAAVLAEHGYFADLSSSSREAFLRACKDGPTEVVRAYLDLGIPVDSRVDISHETALIKAAEGGSIERLGLLLDRGAGIELVDSSGDTALRTALNWSHPEAARFLASRGASTIAENRWGECALEHAIDKDQDENARLLLELGADPSFASIAGLGRSPLRAAITKGNEAILAEMLERGANPNATLDEQGATALHLAVRQQLHSIVEMLVARGADPRRADNYGVSPFEYAVELGVFALVDALSGGERDPAARERAERRALAFQRANDGDFTGAIDALADAGLAVDARNGEGRTALMVACAQGSVEGVRALLARGASPTAEGPNGVTPLSAVGETNTHEIALALIEHGAREVNSRGKAGLLHSTIWNEQVDTTAALLRTVTGLGPDAFGELVNAAVMKRNVTLVRLLHEAGAPLSVHAEIGLETPLHGAVTHYAELDVVRYLLDHGANTEARASLGETPLHKLAGHYQHGEHTIELFRLLLEKGARLDALDQFSRTPYECCTDQSRADLRAVLIDEPLARGASLDELASAQSWATLPIWYAADRRDAVLFFIERGASFEPPADVRSSPLAHAAIEKGDVELLRALIAKGLDCRRIEHYGTSLVSVAAQYGSIECVTALLDAGADPAVEDDWHASAVHSATKFPSVLRLLLDRGCSAGTGIVGTPIVAAVQHGEIECVRLLLDRGASPNVSTPYGQRPLFLAIAKGDPSVLEALLQAGARTDVLDQESGDTPLITAAKAGAAVIVRALLDAGADPTQPGRDGDNALAFLSQRKELRSEFAELLASHGIDVSAPTQIEPLPHELARPNAFFSALYQGDQATLRAELERGADPNARDPWGATALMHAVAAERRDLVELLLERGADPKAKDTEGVSVAGYASFQSDADIDAMLEEKAGEKLLSMDVLNGRAARSMKADDVRKLLQRGELRRITAMLRERKLNPHTTTAGRSLVSVAISVGDADLLSFLVALGLPLGAADLRGGSPLAMALRDGRHEMAEALIADGADVNGTVNGAPLLSQLLDSYDEDSARWLIEHGADVNRRAPNGSSPLHRAAQNGQSAVGEALVAKGADVNARDEDGATPLHRAVENWWGAEGIARAVVQAGASVHAFDRRGLSPLALAVEVSQEDAARWLLEQGADWDEKDPNNDEARSAREIAEQYGIDPNEWPSAARATDDDGALDDNDGEDPALDD
jgi:ankyrin repeat protein